MTLAAADMPRRLRAALMAAILAGGGGMCLYLVAANPNLGSDSLGYLLPVRNLMAGHGLVYQPGQGPHLHFPPGLGLLAWLADQAVGDMELSAMLVSALAYLGVIWLGGRVAALAWGERAGVLAAGMLAFFPGLLSSSYVILSEALFTCLLMGGVFLWLRLAWRENAGLPTALGLGLVMGYAYLTRPEGFLPGLLATAGITLLPGLPRRRLVLALAALLVFMAVSAPYLLYLRSHLGFWALSGKTAEVFMRAGSTVTKGGDYVDRTKVPEAEANSVQALARFVRERLDDMKQRVKHNLLTTARLLARYLLPGVAAAGLVLGLWLARRGWRREERLWPGWRRAGPPLLAGAIFLSPLPVIVSFLVLERYLVIYASLLYLPLAGGATWLLERALPGRADLGLGLLLALVLALNLGWRWAGPDYPAQGLPSQPATLSQALTQPHANLGLRAAGIWLAKEAAGRDRVVFLVLRKGWVAAFHANGQRLAGPFSPRDIGPDLTIEQASDLLARGEAHYLVLDRHYLGTRPRMRPLWENPQEAGRWGLKLRHPDPGGRFMIFVREG